MNIRLKRDFETILANFGYNIYLQRCINSQINNETPVYSEKLERWTIYSGFPGGSRFSGNTQEEANEGLIWNVDMVFYFQAETNPTTGDRIYEEMDRYPNKQAFYNIEFAIPMRGLGGNIIFWEVGAMRIKPV